MQSVDGMRCGRPGVKWRRFWRTEGKDDVATWAYGIALRQAPGTITQACVAKNLKNLKNEEKASTLAHALEDVLLEMEDDTDLSSVFCVLIPPVWLKSKINTFEPPNNGR